jgi:hypothetical protein
LGLILTTYFSKHFSRLFDLFAVIRRYALTFAKVPDWRAFVAVITVNQEHPCISNIHLKEVVVSVKHVAAMIAFCNLHVITSIKKEPIGSRHHSFFIINDSPILVSSLSASFHSPSTIIGSTSSFLSISETGSFVSTGSLDVSTELQATNIINKKNIMVNFTGVHPLL